MSSVCIIIPCYNEEHRLKVDLFKIFLKDHPRTTLLFVNDGSSDATDVILDSICKQYINAKKLTLPVNEGKAQAVRKGVLEVARQDGIEYIGYLDADLATPFSEFIKLEAEIRNKPGVKIVLGSRWKRLGSRIERNWMRHYLGRIFATLVSLLFKMDVYDTQCGAKILRNQDLEPVFRNSFASKWFFDIEILLRLMIVNPTTKMDEWAIEYPLEVWNEIGNSRIRLRDFFSVPLQLIRIQHKYGTKRK